MTTPLFTTAAGYDRRAIMCKAWAIYRRRVASYGAASGSFGMALADAWAEAKRQKADAQRAAELATVVAEDRAQRITTLRAFAYAEECRDRDGSQLSAAHAARCEAEILEAMSYPVAA